jgi:hypothetical protein
MLRSVVLLVLLGDRLPVLFVITWGGPHEQGQIVGDPPVARVYNQFLYTSDLDHLATEATGPEDRAEMMDRHVQRVG